MPSSWSKPTTLLGHKDPAFSGRSTNSTGEVHWREAKVPGGPRSTWNSSEAWVQPKGEGDKENSSLSPFAGSMWRGANHNGTSHCDKPTKVAEEPVRKRRSARRQRPARHSTLLSTDSQGLGCNDHDMDQEPRKSTASLCAELTAQLEAGGDSLLTASLALRGMVWKLSKDKTGCRVVQLALTVLPRALKEELVQELHGHVREAVESPHANYVIQHVVDVMPVARAAFVAEEISGVSAALARHRYACRVIIRLLEHSASEESTLNLVSEILGEAESLTRHSFGRFVIQAVLEHGLESHRHCIAIALASQDNDPRGVLLSAMNRNGSCVFETGMLYCSPEDKDSICSALLCTREHVLELAKSQFGRFVLKALLAYPGEHVKPTLSILEEASPDLQDNKQSKLIVELLENP